MKSAYITPANGNVFADLGFLPTQAKAMLEPADIGRARRGEQLSQHFANAGFKTSVIDAGQNLSHSASDSHFSTMHRAKGLAFDGVIVMTPKSFLADALKTNTQRKLRCAALTRAKRRPCC